MTDRGAHDHTDGHSWHPWIVDSRMGWTVAGVIVTSIGVIVAFFAWRNPVSSSATAPVGTSPSSQMAPALPSSAAPPQTPSEVPQAANTKTAAANTSAVTVPSVMVPDPIDQVVVAVDSTNVVYGTLVAPGTYELVGGHSTMLISYQWHSYAAGIEVDGPNCAIKTSISGPTVVGGIRSPLCSRGRPNQFESGDGIIEVSTGSYTVTVAETLSGATGSFMFAVIH